MLYCILGYSIIIHTHIYILYECKTCTTYSYHFKTTFIMYINFVDLIANHYNDIGPSDIIFYIYYLYHMHIM